MTDDLHRKKPPENDQNYVILPMIHTLLAIRFEPTSQYHSTITRNLNEPELSFNSPAPSQLRTGTSLTIQTETVSVARKGSLRVTSARIATSCTCKMPCSPCQNINALNEIASPINAAISAKIKTRLI